MSITNHVKSCALGIFLSLLIPNILSANVDPEHLLRDDVMIDKIKDATSILDVQYTSVVKIQLKNYLVRFPEKTQELLGRRTLYFPFIEEELARHGLPEDLKYLPVVESNLFPDAKSGVGATGLWQFMPATAKGFGLTINEDVDERLNPVRSTEAAILYLKELFLKYEDWALAIAAYNSGITNVNRAIKKANSKNFWDIRAYLPKETSNYVPAFIAAAYTFKHYMNYNISPALPELDLQITGGIRIYEQVTFNELASWTNLSLDIINALNPGFKKSYIPKSEKGYVIILPRRVQKYVTSHLAGVEKQGESANIMNGHYEKVVFEGFEGDAISEISKFFNVNPYNVYTWNGTYLGDTLQEDTYLNLFVFMDQGLNVNVSSFRGPRPTYFSPLLSNDFNINDMTDNSAEISFLQLTPLEDLNINWIEIMQRPRTKVKKGQTVNQILRQYPDLTLDKLLAINDLDHPRQIRPGTYLFIK